MTDHRIRARNRANARKSTGPKTPQGKEAIVQNARRHGLTGRPDPDRLRAWLAVILDQPQITPSDLMGDDDYFFLALKLAEAEERLVAAQEAMANFEREREVVPTTWQEMMGEYLDVLAFAEEVDSFAPPDFGALKLRMGVVNERKGPRSTGPSPHENRRRLLLRYLNEARARRNRAFAEWISMAADEKQYQMDQVEKERVKRVLARYR
jgi:hypothetical protein